MNWDPRYRRPPMVGDMLTAASDLAAQTAAQMMQAPGQLAARFGPMMQQAGLVPYGAPQQMMPAQPPPQFAQPFMPQPQQVQVNNLRPVPQMHCQPVYPWPDMYYGYGYVNPSMAPGPWPPPGHALAPQPSRSINEPLGLSPQVVLAGATGTATTVVNKPVQLSRMLASVADPATGDTPYELVEITSLSIGGKNAFNGGGRVAASAFRNVDSFAQGSGLEVTPGQSIEISFVNQSTVTLRVGFTMFGPTGE